MAQSIRPGRATTKNKKLGAVFTANAAPAIVSMLLTSGVVLVDGAFLGRVISPTALAAVNLSLPVLYAFMGVGLLVAVGFSSPAVMALGARGLGAGMEKHANAPRDKASQYFSAAVLGVIVLSAVAASACGVFLRPLVALLSGGAGARPDSGILNDLLSGYLTAMLPGYIVMMLNICLSVFVRGEKKPFDALAIGLVASLVNVFLDWLFIARLGWGTRGAAMATGLANAAGCAVGLTRVFSGRSAFRFVWPRLSVRECGAALANGISEAIGQYSVTITAWLCNAACLKYMGSAGLVAFTVTGYLSFIESMVVTGLCIGMAPIAGQAYGAGDRATVTGVFRLAVRTAAVAGLASFGCVALGGRAAADFWTRGNAEIVALTARGASIFALGFLLNGFNALTSAWFTSLCDARRSGLISFLRGLALPVMAILVLPALFGQMGIWMTMPASETLTLLYSAPAIHTAMVRFRGR